MTTATEPLMALRLHAETAADLMTCNAISIRATATIDEAIDFFAHREFSAAPVINESGHPAGVVSQSDLLIHECANRRTQATTDTNPDKRMTVADLMTPAVFAVAPDTQASRVISDMIGLNVHQLFVVDADGVLVGVITAMGVLRHLRP